MDRAVVARDPEGLAEDGSLESGAEELEREDGATARVLGVLADVRAVPEMADSLRMVEDEVPLYSSLKTGGQTRGLSW